MNNSNYREIVRKYYLEFLNREPDIEGWNHYVHLMETKEIDESKLVNIFKNSLEYKLSHPVDLDSNTSPEIRMKKEWNQRAKMNSLFVIATEHSDSEEDFWKSGTIECEKIIGNKEPSKMNVLEIGCGIGRILIPMSKIFGE